MQTSKVNKEINQDRAFDLYDTFDKHGDVMFAEQRSIYQALRLRIPSNKKVLEAGCGNGVGSAILERGVTLFIATDKLEWNIKFARCLYPWMQFEQWDLNFPTHYRAQVVVCIEAFEHVADPQKAMDHLIQAANETVWISTPNGTNQPRPPENPYHVCEYTPQEMLGFIPRSCGVLIWDKTIDKRLDPSTDERILVYEIKVEK